MLGSIPAARLDMRTDAIRSSGSVLDISAVVALVGWTVLELIVIAAIRIARREP